MKQYFRFLQHNISISSQLIYSNAISIGDDGDGNKNGYDDDNVLIYDALVVIKKLTLTEFSIFHYFFHYFFLTMMLLL